jgi:hypothetical protein
VRELTTRHSLVGKIKQHAIEGAKGRIDIRLVLSARGWGGREEAASVMAAAFGGGFDLNCWQVYVTGAGRDGPRNRGGGAQVTVAQFFDRYAARADPAGLIQVQYPSKPALSFSFPVHSTIPCPRRRDS